MSTDICMFVPVMSVDREYSIFVACLSVYKGYL